ncbi:hypothetical protein [Cellulosimicrobium cellulans]|uniref:hypothetical protein n=1 Tax=Cellulosimicrobium cellulans TaxID=1710 RepID=UPI001651D4D1|nr:hypothetical protein [Cellulosimicrobium cellulans]
MSTAAGRGGRAGDRWDGGRGEGRGAAAPPAGGPARGDAVTDDELAAVVRVLLVAAATLLGVAAAARWHLGPWLPTTVGAVAVAVLGRRMPVPLLALAAFLAWCTVTGFATNAEAELTFGAGDAARLGTLMAAALVGRYLLGRRVRTRGGGGASRD